MQKHPYTLTTLDACAQLHAGEDVAHGFFFPEGLPRILACEATVISQSSACREKHWTLTGEVEFRLFFVRSGRISCQSARESFRLEGDLADPAVSILACCHAQPVRLRREGDQVYRAQCRVEASLRSFHEKTETCLQQLSDPAPEQLHARCSYLSGEWQLPVTLELQEDVLLESALPQVEEVLQLTGRWSPVQCHSDAGEAHITSELALQLLYLPKEGKLPLCAHFRVPVSGAVRCSDLPEGAAPDCIPGPVDISCRLYPDVQGEDRLLHLSIRLQCTLCDSRGESAELLRDAFRPQGDLSVTSQSFTLPQLPRRQLLECPIDLLCPLEGETPEACLYTLPRLRLDALRLGEEAGEAQGTLSAQLLCREGEEGLRALHLSAPVTLPLPALCEDTDVEVLGLDVTAQLQGDAWVLRGRAQLALASYPRETLSLVTEAQTCEAPPLQDWGLKLLISAPGDSLWSLARRSRVPLATLSACNPDARDPLAPGSVLLVHK